MTEIRQRKKGYESPISSKEEDFFDRWRLASEIWGIIGSAPEEWSVRIGVYGKWGEGKTSVLEFLKQMAETENNIVVWFNPWAIKSTDELWSLFAGQIYTALSKAGIKVEGEKLFKVKKWTKKAIDPIKQAAQFSSAAKAVVGGALSLFGDFLNIDSDTFKSINKGLEGRKLVVVIDDLDRSSGKLLPELFLSLREILDLPGLAFVLAFDVDIVANALAKEFSAWGRGEEFLEKIIDFPIILPTPTVQQIRRLLDYELKHNFPFVERTSFENIFYALPKNPRKLKLLLRYLWALKKQVERHETWELDWTTIILWQLLKIESAHVARTISGDENLIQNISTWRFHLKLKDQGDNDIQGKVKQRLNEILTEANIEEKDPRHQKIHILINSLGEKNSSLSSARFFYQINLLDKPHAITWKEFDSLFAIWRSNKDLTKINEWINNHLNNISARKEDVCDELFSTTVSYRLKRLDDASSVSTKAKHTEIMTDVILSRELLELLVSKSLPDLGEYFFRSPQKFNSIFNMVKQWIHFRGNDADKKEREMEENFLLKFACYSKEDPLGYINVISPWDLVPPFEDKKEVIGSLKVKLRDIVLPLLADNLIDHFERKGGIASLWGQGESIPQKYILFDSEGFLWASERKEAVFEVLSKASTIEHINQNAYEFIRMVTYGEENGLGLFDGQEMIRKLIRKKDIIGAIWVAGVSRPIQYRGISSMKEERTKLADIAGADDHLPWPDWFQEESGD